MIERIKQFSKPQYLICTMLAILIFSIYLISLCPTVYLIDSGELAAVSYTLGIAHPTGYPLYTLISYFVAHIPGEPIINLNMLSALFTVAAIIFLYLTTKQILKDRLSPLICVSLFAFSPTIWRISITNEVYPLTTLFALLIIYSLFKLRDERGFYIIMYLIGLSMTNHIIIFFLSLPVFLYIIFIYRPDFKKILIGILFASFGVSLYLYIITRTLGGAEVTWGNAYNLQRLFWHITGKQYQVWMFSLPAEEILNNLLNGFSIFLKDFLYILIVPVFFGFYYLFKSERKKFWLFFVTFILNLLYTINYHIPDIESYYIPGLISLIIVFSYGLKFINKYLKWFIVLPVAIVVPVLNYHSCSLRDNTFGIDFGRSHIEQLPEKSLLICAYWDIYSPIIYLKKVKKIRQDLVIINKELLRRTWYIKYLKDEYPEFYKEVKEEVESFLVELYKFEYNKPYNAYAIQIKFIKMLESIVNTKINKGVYFACPFADRDLNQVSPHYFRMPKGLVFEIREDTANYVPFDFSKFHIKKPKIVYDERLRYNLEIVRKIVNNNYLFLRSTNKFEEAEQAKTWLKNFIY